MGVRATLSWVDIQTLLCFDDYGICHVNFHLLSDIIYHNDRKSSNDIAEVHYLLGCDAM
jgi:hypothetical protein